MQDALNQWGDVFGENAVFYHYSMAGELITTFLPIDRENVDRRYYVTNCPDPFVCKKLGVQYALGAIANSWELECQSTTLEN